MVTIIGNGIPKSHFIYDDMSIVLVDARPRPSRDLNPWQIHIPRVKSNFGNRMRQRLLDEYAVCLYTSGQATYLDTEHVYRPYGRPMDIASEFLKMEDYLNEDCYPKPSDDIILWSRNSRVPQLKGLPECPTSSSHSTVPNQWHLKKKMR